MNFSHNPLFITNSRTHFQKSPPDIQYLHFQFYVLCFGKHHRVSFFASLESTGSALPSLLLAQYIDRQTHLPTVPVLFINAGHVTYMLAAPLILHSLADRGRGQKEQRQHTRPGGELWMMVVVQIQAATFNHKLDFYSNLNEIINFGIRFN